MPEIVGAVALIVIVMVMLIVMVIEIESLSRQTQKTERQRKGFFSSFFLVVYTTRCRIGERLLFVSGQVTPFR